MLWTMPLPANIVLRNFGLAMFLAAVGINAGQPFVRTVAESGLTMLFIGVAVLLTTVAIVLLVGHYLMKIPYDDLVGVASGATGNPAILVYSTKMAPTERPDIGYAMIFPSMTIVKVIAVQIVGLLTARRLPVSERRWRRPSADGSNLPRASGGDVSKRSCRQPWPSAPKKAGQPGGPRPRSVFVLSMLARRIHLVRRDLRNHRNGRNIASSGAGGVPDVRIPSLRHRCGFWSASYSPSA